MRPAAEAFPATLEQAPPPEKLARKRLHPRQEAADLAAKLLFSHLAAAAMTAGGAGREDIPATPSTPIGNGQGGSNGRGELWWTTVSPYKEWLAAMPGDVKNAAMSLSAQALVAEALAKKSKDNITVVIVLI